MIFSENGDVYEKLFLGSDLLFFLWFFLMPIKYPDHLFASKTKIETPLIFDENSHTFLYTIVYLLNINFINSIKCTSISMSS